MNTVLNKSQDLANLYTKHCHSSKAKTAIKHTSHLNTCDISTQNLVPKVQKKKRHTDNSVCT